ncbi:MAG: hypothetical protein ACP5KZ_09695, partial [bacterium]
EYRGFMISSGGEGSHIRLDPKIKDVFIIDENNLGAGYFTDLGLKIRWNPERALNNLVTRYISLDKHAKDQYGIRLTERPYEIGVTDPDTSFDNGYVPGCAGDFTDSQNAKAAWLNDPNVSCFIYTNRIKKYAQDYWPLVQKHYEPQGINNWEGLAEMARNMVIAHELGHAVNLQNLASGQIHCPDENCIIWRSINWLGIQTSFCSETRQNVSLYK